MGDVTALKFPKEFENEDTLLNVEVALLLESRKKQNDNAADAGGGNEVELSELFLKTLTYSNASDATKTSRPQKQFAKSCNQKRCINTRLHNWPISAPKLQKKHV